MKYNFAAIEKKWQKKWEEKKIFQVKEQKNKKKFYVLEMFPYPSAQGLHMGHALNYSIGDIYSRFKRMGGFNVLYPMGFDSFGLPAENAAINAKSHPKKFTESAIKNYINQMKALGLSYDWSRKVEAHNPEYYKWDQWIFLKMLEKGLAYRKKAAVNWCDKCKTVLANEQVVNGKCWRHEDIKVEIKHLEQWFLKITDYADDLYESLKELKGWPDKIKAMQKNWIGKSHGCEINFKVEGENWPIFTTRPDTIFGVTFMVVSAQHSRLMELVTEDQKKQVENFLKKLKSVSEKELEVMEKEGVFTGSYATNPINKEQIPIYVGNFVLADYGSGMVMAVPGHDQRDFDFAKKYKLKIKEVISGGDIKKRAYVGEGKLVNSKEFNGVGSKKAKDRIIDYLKKEKLGKKKVQFKLRDWLISRQRFWGTPIPIIYCGKCGVVPVKEKDLPVKLPEKVKFRKGNPLETTSSWINVKCPKCKGKAKRETDTMDTFVNSSWYFLRYCDPKNKSKIFDPKKVAYWMPIDQYIGGVEHATGHLIYFRFYTKFLKDIGLLKFAEPVSKLFNQGILHGIDKNRMSKSKGNVILPEEISKKYGIDTARLFLVSIASPDKDIDWDDKGIKGVFKFTNKVMDYFNSVKTGKADAKTESKLNKTIKEITRDIEDFKYNLAVIKIRELFNSLPKTTSKDVLEKFLKLLHVFCPHITEELWQKLGNKNFISLSKWPVADLKKINLSFEKQDQAVDKIVNDIISILKIIQARGEKAEKIYVYVIPNEKSLYDGVGITKRVGKPVKIFAVNDKAKYDPTNKSKNTKPGKPGIYIE
ncbi:MAG: leucine--tRNA ligase [archaeon]